MVNLYIFNFNIIMLQRLKNLLQKNNYTALAIKLGGFLILAFVFDVVLGGVLKNFYFKQKSGWEFRTKYSVETTQADILIFGASRAQQQYNPVFFEERMLQSCYNVGRDGETIFYYYGVLRSILKRYSPKIIILDIENSVFKESQSSYDKLSILLPFYKDHPEMRSIIDMRSRFEKLKLQSNVYPYNSLLFKIALGNINTNKTDDIKGYLPLTRLWTEPLKTVDLSIKYNLDTNKINYYKAFINDCYKAQVKLYIVCSPYYLRLKGSDSSMILAKHIANEKNIDFIDFSGDKSFLNNSKLFNDPVHVNITGSKIFCNKLIDTLNYRSYEVVIKNN